MSIAVFAQLPRVSDIGIKSIAFQKLKAPREDLICSIPDRIEEKGIWPIRILRNPSRLAGALEKINRRGHSMKIWFVLSYSQKSIYQCLISLDRISRL